VELLKIIIKRGFITSGIIFLYGILLQNKIIYMGMFGGSLLSILGFYMISLDAKTSLHSNSPFKVSVIGYIKRYILYGIYLGVMAKFFGMPMIIAGALGLLSIKFNIWLYFGVKNIKSLKSKYLP
jgi:hypothetical protein